MRIALLVISGGLFFSSPAFAQKVTFEGKWAGQMVSTAGDPIRVDVTIAGAKGTLHISRNGYSPTNELQDPCQRVDIPIEEGARTETTLDFVVRGDEVLRGCFKGAGSLKLLDANKLDGTLKDGRHFQLVRQ